MVNLDSYDSEGPLTPETDDSTEVRSEIIPSLVISAMLSPSPHSSTLFLLQQSHSVYKVLVLVALTENVCFIC